jgi:alkylhydroperoxidase/carboxymuconolactone decarboxylase family protein YurZ
MRSLLTPGFRCTDYLFDLKGEAMSEQTPETPVLDLLKRINAASIDASTLDQETLMLVRIAALVAVDAPPASYLLNIGAASEIGIDPDQVQGVLSAVSPIVGTPRVVSAAGNILRALGVATELAELEAETEQT